MSPSFHFYFITKKHQTNFSSSKNIITMIKNDVKHKNQPYYLKLFKDLEDNYENP